MLAIFVWTLDDIIGGIVLGLMILFFGGWFLIIFIRWLLETIERWWKK